MACDRRRGEVRQIAVIDRGCIFHALDQLPQPRAQDHADRRPRRRPLADEGDRFFQFSSIPIIVAPPVPILFVQRSATIQSVLTTLSRKAHASEIGVMMTARDRRLERRVTLPRKKSFFS